MSASRFFDLLGDIFLYKEEYTLKRTDITGHTRLACFIAHPAKHSISPTMHSFSFQETDIDAVYLAFDVEPEGLAESIQVVRTFDMLGANLSMPHKIAAVRYMDALSEAAQLIGAVNTIVNEDGKLTGHNTDGYGFCESLRQNQVPIKGQTMTMLGGGGAATAMYCQAALDGMAEIHLFNRKSPRYAAVEKKAAEISEKTGCKITVHDLADQDALKESLAASSLLVNATSVGMGSDETPLKDVRLLRPDLTVYDAIYEPREPRLLQDAKKVGAKTINGLGMLLYQGAEAFELWTGLKMPVDQVQPIIEKKLNESGKEK